MLISHNEDKSDKNDDRCDGNPIAAGGIKGAEGAITFALKGTDEGVIKAYEICGEIKGARLPNWMFWIARNVPFPFEISSREDKNIEICLCGTRTFGLSYPGELS